MLGTAIVVVRAVTLRGWCERQGYARIGFGEAVGTVLPA